MANFDQLKQSVAALIRTNGAEEITGQIMQDVLLTIINSISGGYMFGGVAQHSGNVGNPDYNVFYLAGSGAYTGYGDAINIPNGCYGVFRYNGSWTQDVVDIGVHLTGTIREGETNGVTGDVINTALQQLFNNIMNILDTLTFTYNTPSGQQATKAMLDVIVTPTGGASHVLTTLTLVSATAAAAGLMSAEDKQKVDRMLTDFRSLSFSDTTAVADQATKIVQTLSATLGENPEAITTMTFLAATASKAGLLSAADKAKLDALWSSGYQFAGIATPSTTPISTTSKIFYIATEAGTYFNAVTVTQGINILSWDGTSWSAVQVVGIDDEPTAGSSNLVESGGVYKDVEGTVSAAYDLTNNSFVNRVLQYFYTTSSVYTGSKHYLEIAYKHNNDNRYYNRLVIQRSAVQASEVFTENYSTKEEAINAFIASPVRENASNTVIFDVTSVTSDNSGQYEFDFINGVAPNSNPIFDKYISPKNLFKTNMGEVFISEVLTYPNDGYKLDNILIAEFCVLNTTTNKYEISLQSVFTKEGFSNIYGTLISKIGNDGFNTRDDALAYWNDNIGGHILQMADGRGYVSYNKIENIDKLPSSINTRLYLNKDTDNTENAASIMEYFNSIRKENIFKYDTKLNLLIDEFYLNPEFIDLSEIDSIRICCGGTISSKIYNLVYIYRTSSLSTRVMYQKEYETVDAALADFKGVFGNIYGKIKVNDSFAKELTSGFYTDVAISDINTELLSADKCPAIGSVINPHNNLIGKKVVWEGDSIAADNSWNASGWRNRIEEKYNIFGVSYAIGGSTITNNVSGLEERHNMAARVDSDVETTESCDYFIFDGGTNDADRIGRIVRWVDGSDNTKYERLPQSSFPAKFGTWNDTDFSGEYDKDTFCGALEYFIWKVLSSYKGVRIGYIVAPKMGMTSSLTFFNRLEYFHEAMAICKKWGVPVINLWEDSWMNPNMPNQYQKYSDDPSENRTANVQAGNFYLDGQHPAPAGFDYLSKMIGEWMNNL